jgi:hypothetical protein
VCDFCAFYRPPDHPEVYVLPRDVLLKKIEETVALGGDQILMQGGLHPKLPLEWYEELLGDIKSHFPRVNIHDPRVQPPRDPSPHESQQAAAAHGARALAGGRTGESAGRRR